MAQVGRLVKESLIEHVTNRLNEHPNFFVTSITKLPASEADVFRQKLFASHARLVMVKRRLGLRAVEGLKLSGSRELLQGSVAFILASGEDAAQIAKLISDFRKSHEEQLVVQGAFIDGQLLDKSRVEQLAQLPSKFVLLAQVVGAIESPMADVIFTLERLIGDLGWVVEQMATKPPAEVSNP